MRGTVLYRASSSIKDHGAMSLAGSLQICCQLSSLNLSDNEIGDSGACCLGNYLKHCSSLCILMLNGNLISGCGAVGVAEGVKSAGTCTH